MSAPERMKMELRPTASFDRWMQVVDERYCSSEPVEYVKAVRLEELDAVCAEWAEVSQSNYQRAKAAEAKLAKAVEALEQCAEAFELHSSAYPAMVKGYTLDALTNASATLAAIKGDTP
jgi:hypothetical protein